MADGGGFHTPSPARNNKGNLDSRLMVESVANHFVRDVVFVLIPMVSAQRTVDQGRQNNQRTQEQDRVHG
jgi:hypothetical protein